MCTLVSKSRIWGARRKRLSGLEDLLAIVGPITSCFGNGGEQAASPRIAPSWVTSSISTTGQFRICPNVSRSTSSFSCRCYGSHLTYMVPSVNKDDRFDLGSYSSLSCCCPAFPSSSISSYSIHTYNICYSNHIITRISIQTAGLAFGSTDSTDLCSYRVRGVDGSCAKHLTVESYMVVMLLTVILIIISIPSPLSPSLFHSTYLFGKSFPPQPSFSSSGLTTWIPQTVYCYFWAYPFFSFSVLHFFSCRFRAVD